MRTQFSRRKVLELLLGVSSTLILPKIAFAKGFNSFDEDYTRSIMPAWANYGGDLLKQEQLRGFYQIFHDVNKDDLKRKNRLLFIAELYGISTTNLVSQTKVQRSKDLKLAERLVFDVPVKNFANFIPYMYEDNREIIFKLNGNEVENLRFNELGKSRLALIIGIREGEFATGEKKDEFLVETYSQAKIVTENTNISPILLTAIAYEESGGFPWAISTTGALGRYGLTSHIYGQRQWSDYKFRSAINPFDTDISAHRAVDNLSLLFNKTNGDISKILAKYHDGESTKNNKPGDIYAKKVFKKIKKLKKIL